MEFKKKTIIWEDNNEPPKDYIWAKKDGKFYEYSYATRSWIESKSISGGSGGSGGGSDEGGGGSEPAEFVLRFKKENFFEYHDTYPNVVPIANVDDEFTLDEIFEMSDNTISNWINLFEKQVEVAENHNGVRTWDPNSYAGSAFILTDDGGIDGASGGNDDEYGVFPQLAMEYYNGIKLQVDGTNFGGGSIGVPRVIFSKTQEGKWKIDQISSSI